MNGHFVFASSVHSHNAIIISKAIKSDNQKISFTGSGLYYQMLCIICMAVNDDTFNAIKLYVMLCYVMLLPSSKVLEMVICILGMLLV